MGIFTQDINSAIWQSMVDCGSSFHNEILQPVSDNLYGSYDGQTLKVRSKNGIGNYAVSINEREDLFRNYLPFLSCIRSQNMLLKVYQMDLDGGNMLIETPAFSFYGKTLSNIRIKTSKSIFNSQINAEFIENVSIDMPLIKFKSATGVINHKFGMYIPGAGKNVNISDDCIVCLESWYDLEVLTGLYNVIDNRGFNRLQGLNPFSTWDYLSCAISADLSCFNALPVLKDTRVDELLNLPEYLKNKNRYIISFPSDSLRCINFIKHSEDISNFRLCKPNELHTLEVNYLTEDGYYICY